MKANADSLLDYLSHADRQYIVPLFQRKYIWKEKNWKTLWEDIFSYYQVDNILNSSPHFMGAIVSIPLTIQSSGLSQFLVIDGQQRLTTFSILLCAIRDTLESRKKQIQAYLCNDQQKGFDYLRLLPTQEDRDVFQKLITGEITDIINSNSNIYNCYNYFINKLKSNSPNHSSTLDINKIYMIINKCLQVVVIDLSDTDDPYRIFESLNFKGEKLTQTDLIRNLILMKFQSSASNCSQEQETIYNQYWKPLETLLGDQLERFFFQYIRLRNCVKGNIYNIYKDMKSLLDKDNNIVQSLTDILECANIYKTFLNPEKENNIHIREELAFLGEMKSQAVYSLLLKISLYRNKEVDDNIFLSCLKILNSLLLRRTICSQPVNALNNLIVHLLSSFPNNVSHVNEWLSEELIYKKNFWPNNETFRQAIVSSNISDKDKQMLFLKSIEKYLAGKEVINLSSGITLEHVMPQKLSLEWRNSLGENTCFEIQDKYLSNFGNLTLTGYNSELSNKTFEEKKNMPKGYCNSGIRMNLDIAKNDKWGKDEIIARAKYLADIAVKIWKYPERKKSSKKTLTLNDSWTFQKVHTLLIKDVPYPVLSWRKAAFKIIEFIREEYYHNNTNEFPEVVKNNKLASIDTNFNVFGLDDSANEIKRKIKTWLRKLNIDESLFKFEIE